MEFVFIIIGFAVLVFAFSSLFQGSNTQDSSFGEEENEQVDTDADLAYENDPEEASHTQADISEAPVSTETTTSAEEQHDIQQQQFAERIPSEQYENETENTHEAAIGKHISNQSFKSDSKIKRQNTKKQLQHNMTRTGLINGIIMSEVLDQPRAVKPYRSVISERYH